MGAAFSSAYSHFLLGAQCNIAGLIRRGGRQLLFCQHADGERQRLQLGYQQFNQFRTDVAAAGEWGHETQTGMGRWSGMRGSKLPVDINVGRQIASAQQQMARESDVQAKAPAWL
jgi:conjugal transfer mating pair stabilization protein TraG